MDIARSRCREFVLIQDPTDERHVLLRPTNPMAVANLAAALQTFTQNTNSQPQGIRQINTTRDHGNPEPGARQESPHCSKNPTSSNTHVKRSDKGRTELLKKKLLSCREGIGW
jgi:hypothetical protein